MKLSKVTFVSAIEAPDGGSGIHRKDFSEPGYEISQDGAVTIVTHKQSGGRVVTNIPCFGSPLQYIIYDIDESVAPARLTEPELLAVLDAGVASSRLPELAEPFTDPSDTQTGTPKAKRGRPPKGG